MSDSEEDKTKSPFDSETEDETLALSKNELSNILSEAEIVQEKSTEEPVIEQDKDISEDEKGSEEETILEEGIEETMEPVSELTEGDEFDISGEVDELSPEDLENIELEEGDIENYTQELESELGEELEMPVIEEGEEETEGGLRGIEDELGDIDTEGINLEANLDDEEMDLDTYLESVKADIDLEATVEEGKEAPEESPVIGDMDEIESFQRDAEEAFKEAGIEGIGEDFEPDKGDEELLKGLEEADVTLTEEETAEIGERAEVKEGAEEFSLSEEIEAGVESQKGEESEAPETLFEGEIDLTEEEEQILSEDLDLEAEEPESEEVVTVTGAELDKIAETEGGAGGPAEFEESVSAGGDKTAIDKTLFNDITVILKYLDNLLGELPEEKIKEFSKSKYFSLYKEVFEKLNLT